MVRVTVENRFDAPPDFVRDWLTDFRPDDGQRWFEFKAPVQVTRKGNEFHTEGPHPVGYAKGVVVIDSPTAWHATNQFSKTRGGPVIGVGQVRETVRAEGQGTLHRAEITFEPKTLGLKVMFGLMGRSMMDKSMTKGFAKIKQEMEAQYKAGKPPTA